MYREELYQRYGIWGEYAYQRYGDWAEFFMGHGLDSYLFDLEQVRSEAEDSTQFQTVPIRSLEAA